MNKVECNLKFERDGKAGDVITIKHQLQRIFRADRLVLEDTLGGMGTFILAARLRGELQGPSGGSPAGLPSAFFGPNTVGNEVSWKTGALGDEIELDFRFAVDCRLTVTLKGMSVE